MIYFLINNDYHYFDFEMHAAQLQPEAVHLLEIPHTLARRDSSRWGTSTRFDQVPNKGIARTVQHHLRSAKAIASRVKPAAQDVLFVYTEYELLNQFVVTLFRQAGARVYMIEDGGIATYITFRNPVSEPLTFRERVLQAIYRCLPGARQIRLQKIGGNLYPWMPDSDFNGVCLYRSIAIGRDMPVIPLRRPAQAHLRNLDRQTILFLNQDLYAFSYLNDNEYLDILQVLIASLASGFEHVLFKFHPRETLEWRARISREVLDQWPNVACLTDNQGIEATAEQHGAGLAASFNSTALMNLTHRGVEPVFLYHLFPTLTQYADFDQNTKVLEELGYAFVPDAASVTPRYRSGLVADASKSSDRVSIRELCTVFQ